MSGWVKYLLPVAFVVALVFPTLEQSVGLFRFEQRNENRAMAKAPVPDITYLDGFPTQFEAWYNDHFPFRAPLLRIFHRFYVDLFGVSPDPKRSLIGKNGHCFQGGKERDIIEGRLQLSARQLDSLHAMWGQRMAYFDSLHIKCYWFIIPIKENVYPELLPINVIPRNNPRRAEQLTQKLNPEFGNLVHDLLPVLWRSKDTANLFQRMDNHWNYEAGAIAANEILNVVKRDFPHTGHVPFEHITWADSLNRGGFHRTVLGNDDMPDPYRYPHSDQKRAHALSGYGFVAPPGFAYPWEYEMRFGVDADTLAPKALIIRDSFTTYAIPFLAEGFHESVFIFDAWRYALDRQIVETVRPDVVIFLTLETHIENLINYEKERARHWSGQ